MTVLEAKEYVKEKYNYTNTRTVFYQRLVDNHLFTDDTINSVKGKKRVVDKEKLDNYFKSITSSFLLNTVAKENNIPYSRLNYICMKHFIELDRPFGHPTFKSQEDIDNAIRLSKKGN